MQLTQCNNQSSLSMEHVWHKQSQQRIHVGEHIHPWIYFNFFVYVLINPPSLGSKAAAGIFDKQPADFAEHQGERSPGGNPIVTIPVPMFVKGCSAAASGEERGGRVDPPAP